MEKLTIQQLSPYLFTNCQARLTFKEDSDMPWYYDTEELVELSGMILDWYGNDIIKIVPALLPISCLTKEITHNGETFIPIVELLKPNCNIHRPKNLVWMGDSIVYENLVLLQTKNIYLSYEKFQKLAEWHINFNGIPEGLYIDKSKL